MKKTFLMALCMVLTEGGVSFTNIHDTGKGVSAQIRSREPADTADLNPKLTKLKVSFINNQGQADKRVKFYAHTVGGTVFITDDGKIVYSFLPIENEKPARGFVLKEELVDGNVARVKGERKAITSVNYFKGNDPSKWKRNLPTYDIVSLGQVYEGIELKLKAHGNNVEKLFYVKAGSQPERIRLKVNGGRLNVNKTGDLEIQTEHGTVRMTKPVAYQERRGKKEFVEVAYVVKGDEYGFELGEYDRRKDIIIDPILAATYLGGSWNDFAYAIALDGNGNVYVAGTTEWSDFPGIGAGSADSVFVYPEEAFVAKLDSSLSTILAVTFLGGSAYETAYAIALDSKGNVYLAGGTNSSDFPGVGPGSADSTYASDFQAPFGAYHEAFVAKLDSNLGKILNATFLGGSSVDDAHAIALDSKGNVYVAGSTFSSDFPGVGLGSADSTNFSGEAFVAKLDSNLGKILNATFLGGSKGEDAYGIVLDSKGNVYVAGETFSPDFPGVGPGSADSTFADPGYKEAFVAKLDSSLGKILNATFLGGSQFDYAQAIAIDGLGNIYVAGATFSPDFPGVGPGSADSILAGSTEAFIAKLDSNLSSILAATFLGGGWEYEGARAIALDSKGNVYVTGRTFSPDFPGIGPGSVDSTYVETEAFVAKLDSSLSSILAATFLGGNYIDDGRAIALDSKGNIYVAGTTGSSDFPGVGPGSADSTNFSGEAFVAKIAFEEPARFEYAAKIVCGVQKDPKDMRLARGFYATAINIHNPNDSDVKFLKKLTLTFPPAAQSPGKVMPISEDKAGPDEALEVDCEDLRRRLFPKGFPTPYIKGFVVIRSPESLDVTAVYTTATLDRKGQAADHSSIHVEQIRERQIGRQQAKPEMIPD